MDVSSSNDITGEIHMVRLISPVYVSFNSRANVNEVNIMSSVTYPSRDMYGSPRVESVIHIKVCSGKDTRKQGDAGSDKGSQGG